MTVETRQASDLTTVERAVLEAVAYSDVFDYAVTLEEVHRALLLRASISEVEATLSDRDVGAMVSKVGSYYVLDEREALVEAREQRMRASAALMRQARVYGAWIARLPFVRMVAVTGSLAVDNAEAGDDVDYLIVTSKGRVWLARALAIAVVRLAGLRGLTLCPNYVLSESALELTDRDVYTARELLQMRPIAGHATYTGMLAANAWAAELLPNWRRKAEVAAEGRSLLARLGEGMLGGRLGGALERALLQRKGRELRSADPDNAEVRFDETVCKGHFEGHRARLKQRLETRLRELGVER